MSIKNFTNEELIDELRRREKKLKTESSFYESLEPPFMICITLTMPIGLRYMLSFIARKRGLADEDIAKWLYGQVETAIERKYNVLKNADR